MYRINKSPLELNRLLLEYYRLYRNKVREVIKPFIADANRYSFEKKIGTRVCTKLRFEVSNGSYTETFLKACRDDDNFLIKVLVGSITQHTQIIDEVIKNGGTDCVKSLTYKDAFGRGYQDGEVVDDFNTIIKEIFVNRLYDGKGINEDLAFDKDRFVKELDLRICPYCGRSYIYRVVKTGKSKKEVSVKPQIDHFLPKSAYPFLAMNFMNLIPCCPQCNMSPCKVDNDPLDNNHKTITYLMHPYLFIDKDILFRYRLTSSDLMNLDSYEVGVGYKDRNLKFGYNSFLAIDKLYAAHRQEVCNMMQRVQAFHSAINGFYQGVGVPAISDTLILYAILGYALNADEESKQLLYKFKKDILMQMYNVIPTGRTYFLDWNNLEVTFNT